MEFPLLDDISHPDKVSKRKPGRDFRLHGFRKIARFSTLSFTSRRQLRDLLLPIQWGPNLLIKLTGCWVIGFLYQFCKSSLYQLTFKIEKLHTFQNLKEHFSDLSGSQCISEGHGPSDCCYPPCCGWWTQRLRQWRLWHWGLLDAGVFFGVKKRGMRAIPTQNESSCLGSQWFDTWILLKIQKL